MHLNRKSGVIEVVCGPMFAGETETLLSRIRRLSYAKKNIIVFKPLMDARYSEDEIVSHNKSKVKSINIKEATDVLKYVTKSTDVVVIDEVQFIDREIVKIVDFLADQGIDVIVTGLDKDFRGEPFLFMDELLARAEVVTKLTAVCVVCGEPATRTQRIINGKPAKYTDPIIMIGAEESYEARCRRHHQVTYKKKRYELKK